MAKFCKFIEFTARLLLISRPYIQNAGATQFYNRYSYCLSNPLKYVDPSGNSTYGYGCNNLAQQLNYNLQMEDNHWFQNMTGLDCQMIFINNNPFGIYDGGGGGDGGNAGGGGEDGQFTYLGGGQFSGVGVSVDNKGDIEIEWGTMEKPTLEDIVYTAYYNSINGTNVQLLNTYEHHHKTISMGDANSGGAQSGGCWYDNVGYANYGLGIVAEGMSDLGKAARVIQIGKFGGVASLVVGTIADGFGVSNYYKYGPNNPNSVSPSKAGLNTGIAVYGIWNPAVAIVYDGIDQFYPGGWNGWINDWHNSLNPNNDPFIEQQIIQHSMNPF